MRAGVLVRNRRVVATADDLSVLHHERSDGHLAPLCGTCREAQGLAHPRSVEIGVHYSHSIVAGGLPETSYTTRLIPRTSLMMRPETFPRISCGNGAH